MLYEQTLHETSNVAEITRGGHIEALIPANVMHSFVASNNKITWKLKFQGDIRRWPDVKDEFDLVVRPIPL